MTALLPAFASAHRDIAPLVGRVHHADAYELLARLPDGSVDAVITDPPYGVGLDVWDKPIDIDRFVSECYRVLKPTGFLFFTIQMPTMIDWLVALRASPFIYRDHIAWVKRAAAAIAQPLMRSHESIFIYAKSKDAQYVETKGLWSDVKLPGLLFDLITIGSIDRYIKDLWLKLKSNGTSISGNNLARHSAYSYMALDSDRSPEYANFTNVWSFLPETRAHRDGNSHHATQKPTKMIERAVALLTPPDGIVLDCFVGSGTTAVAARNTGRQFIVGDITHEYVLVARDRLNTEFGVRHTRKETDLDGLPLFAATG